MATIEPNQWEESEDWREVVMPEFHKDFLDAIAEAHSEGYTVHKVMTVGGVPVVFDVS